MGCCCLRPRCRAWEHQCPYAIRQLLIRHGPCVATYNPAQTEELQVAKGVGQDGWESQREAWAWRHAATPVVDLVIEGYEERFQAVATLLGEVMLRHPYFFFFWKKHEQVR